MKSNRHLITDTYQTYSPYLIAYFYQRINDYETAQDLTQDVFLRIINRKYMICEETARNILFTIARNLLYDYLRHHYRTLEITNSYSCHQTNTEANETESRLFAEELNKLERKAIKNLSPQCRTVYIMSRYQEKSASDISEKLKLSKRTVENHLFTARKSLRQYIRQCI